MERFAAGDDEAFREVYQALARRLYRYGRRALRDEDCVEDLVHTVFERMICARGRFTKGARVWPWALSIIKRLQIDQMRKRTEHLLPDAEDSFEVPAHEPGPEEHVIGMEAEQRLCRLVAQLPRPQREAWQLMYGRQMSYGQASVALGVSVAAVMQRVSRAARCLRAACMEDAMNLAQQVTESKETSASAAFAREA